MPCGAWVCVSVEMFYRPALKKFTSCLKARGQPQDSCRFLLKYSWDAPVRRQAAINMVTNRLNYTHVRWRGLFVYMRSPFEKPVCVISILFGRQCFRLVGVDRLFCQFGPLWISLLLEGGFPRSVIRCVVCLVPWGCLLFLRWCPSFSLAPRDSPVSHLYC